MALELGIWRIGEGLTPLEFGALDLEYRLEDILDRNIAIVSPHWMVIGRQVHTDFAGTIDLLAIDQQGNLVVMELKRDRTPRDIVAQILDYGSWVRTLQADRIAKIYSEYRARFKSSEPDQSLDEAFCKRFGLKEMPDELNEDHELVMVASSLDPGTERVVKYLAEHHGLPINAIFFRVFRDEDKEYLARAWLTEPTIPDPGGSQDITRGEWNGEYYVSFGIGEHRVWDEAVKYGFISGGGAPWYSGTLNLLEPAARIWVNVPGVGYVGVGEVLDAPVPVDEFTVADDSGSKVPLISLPVKARGMKRASENKDAAEYLVRVKWLKTLPLNQAVKEKGFFGNQNTVAKPRTPKWSHTVERLKKRFDVQ